MRLFIIILIQKLHCLLKKHAATLMSNFLIYYSTHRIIFKLQTFKLALKVDKCLFTKKELYMNAIFIEKRNLQRPLEIFKCMGIQGNYSQKTKFIT